MQKRLFLILCLMVFGVVGAKESGGPFTESGRTKPPREVVPQREAVPLEAKKKSKFAFLQKVNTQEVFTVLIDVCREAKDIAGTPKEKRKKKKRRFFKRLLVSVCNLAINTMLKTDKRSYGGVQPTIVQLAQDFFAMLENTNGTLERTEQTECLYSLFQIGDEEKQEAAIYKLLESRDTAQAFLQALFQALFAYCSEKLNDLQYYCHKRSVREGNKCFFTFRSPGDALEGEVCGEVSGYEECARMARAVVDRVSSRRLLYSEQVALPAVWCLIKVVADASDVALYKNYGVTEEQQGVFTDKMSALISDVHNFLAYDNLLASFKKLSPYVEPLEQAKEKGALEEAVRKALEEPDVRPVFIDEVFSYLGLYLQEKLSEAFSDLYCKVFYSVNE